MREIKFRAWDKELKHMHYGNTHISMELNERGELKSNALYYMQYTGLKDKLGKEIYEGDILSRLRNKDENNWASEMVHNPDYYATVTFKNGCFVCEETDQTIYEHIRPMRITEHTEYEVIGNIYEHPELINKS